MIDTLKEYSEKERLSDDVVKANRLAEITITLESGRRIYRYIKLVDGKDGRSIKNIEIKKV